VQFLFFHFKKGTQHIFLAVKSRPRFSLCGRAPYQKKLKVFLRPSPFLHMMQMHKCNWFLNCRAVPYVLHVHCMCQYTVLYIKVHARICISRGYKQMKSHQSQKLQNYAGLADSIQNRQILQQDINNFEGPIIDIRRVRYLQYILLNIPTVSTLSPAMYCKLRTLNLLQIVLLDFIRRSRTRSGSASQWPPFCVSFPLNVHHGPNILGLLSFELRRNCCDRYR
jgi:hypothetical protein